MLQTWRYWHIKPVVPRVIGHGQSITEGEFIDKVKQVATDDRQSDSEWDRVSR